MKILCCYVPGMLRPETEAALKKHAPGLVDWRAISEANPNFYAQTLARMWQLGDSFANVEQDVVVREDVIYAFITCPRLYCAYPYAWLTNVGPALGCTRWRREFLLAFPTVMQEAQAMNVSWRQLDVVLMRRILATKYGQQPHVHLPPVEHFNEAKQLLPGADSSPMMSVPVNDIGMLYQ